jgi:hypothetical protein
LVADLAPPKEAPPGGDAPSGGEDDAAA